MTETSTAAKLFIRDEYFHHHSLEILNSHLVLKGDKLKVKDYSIEI
jgi:hypothetical protein